MRMGLLLSSLLHLSLIGFGLFTLAGQNLERHELDVESIAVDLVPIGDEMSVREGAKQAPPEEAPAPKPTQKPEINQAARHVGDGQVDSAAPLNPRQRVREVEAPPPPSTSPPPPTTTQQVQAAKPTEPPSSQQASASPVEEPAPVETVPADEPQQAAASIPPLPQHAPPPKQKPQRPQIAAAAPPHAAPTQTQETIDDLVEKSAALIDRTPTQGGGMRRAVEPAGAGASRSIGDNQQLAQTIQNVIGSCLKDKARITALTGSRSNDLIVKVHMRLNRDGAIEGVPDLTPSGGEAAEREIAVTQGFAALARCSPFAGLPPDRYDDGWNEVILTWRPLD